MFLTLSSCSSDDSDDNNSNNELVGIWLYNRTLDVTNGEVVNIFTPSECSLNDRFTFFSNGTYTYMDFSIDSLGNCSSPNSDLEEGSYSNTGNSIYEFTETTNGINESWGPVTIEFIDANTMQMIYYQEDSSNNVVSHNDEFRKAN